MNHYRRPAAIPDDNDDVYCGDGLLGLVKGRGSRMWCATCQQDVPGVATSKSDTRVRCARCGQALTRVRNDFPSPTPAQVPFEDMPEFIELEDWEFAEAIHVAQSVAREAAASPVSVPGPFTKQVRPSSSTVPRAIEPGDACERDAPAPSAKSPPTTAWLVVAFGMGLFVCGAALIALALAQGRPSLWQLGLPMVLGGQVAVLSVVVWQLEAVWNSNRATFVALHAVDDQVRQLRTQWAVSARGEDLEEQPFYRHLAEKAPPEVLLADLKDQLDLLSLHLAQQKRAA